MKTVATNRKARHDYEVLDTFMAGVILTGAEVKSCRSGHVHLKGAYVTVNNTGLYLRNMTIAAYQPAGLNQVVRDEYQLLLTKKEISQLQKKLQETGLTVVPLSVKAGNFIKVEIALVRGQKKYDKRQKKKSMDIDRRLRRGDREV